MIVADSEVVDAGGVDVKERLTVRATSVLRICSRVRATACFCAALAAER